MFSGIVEEYAEVVRIVKEQENLHLTLKCSFVDELKIDQSISHNGVCLTVVSLQDGTYTVTAMKETIERSNIGLPCTAHRRIMPSLAPDSAGVPGPGEISTPSYSSITPDVAGSIASLRTTVTVAPSVLR